MLAALNEGFAGLWQALPISGKVTIPLADTKTNVSNFGFIGVVTTKPLVPGFPVIVNGDYSLYCPELGQYVLPEQTNIQNILPI
jgi:hypothetical protein